MPDSLKQQRVVYVSVALSNLLTGDPLRKEYENAALPRLLTEGWRVVSMVTGGENNAYVLLERED